MIRLPKIKKMYQPIKNSRSKNDKDGQALLGNDESELKASEALLSLADDKESNENSREEKSGKSLSKSSQSYELSSEPKPLLVFDKVSKEYENGFKALDNVSFSLNRGEFVFLIGKSGAGKSTLIKLLIREQELTSGSIFFDGVNVSLVPKEKVFLLRRRIGVVFQDFKVLYSKNVFDNVAVALEVVDAPKEEIEEVVSNVLNLVGLLNKRNNYPSELSGGELQRLAIARALANEPDLLVADEPTGNIDPLSSSQVVEIFEKANNMGVAILMATHDERVVNDLNKRVIKLEAGKVVSDKHGGKYD